MNRLWGSTAVLSIALAGVQPWPLMAQALNERGELTASDGTVLCTPEGDKACDPNDPALVQLLAETEARIAAAAQAAAEAQAQADAAAAQAAAEAQAQADAAAAQAAAEAQAQADAAAAQAAAEAQAQADSAAAQEAEAKAQADAAAAQAAAEAQAQADAAAKAQADAAAAQAAADAQAQADAAAAVQAAAQAQAAADAAAAQAAAEAEAAQAAAQAQAQADADAAAAQAGADAQAKADAEAQAEAAAKAQADAAAQAEAKAQADAAAAQAGVDAQAQADAAAQAAAEAEAQADAAAAQAATEAQAQADAVQPPADLAKDMATQEKALAAAKAELAVQADGNLVDPNLGLKTAEETVDPNAAPVEAPVVTQAEVQSLTSLMAEPAAEAPTAAEPAEAPLAVADAPADTAPAPAAIETTTQVITAQSARSATQEFAAAPVAVEGGRKNRLSDLEKFGLVALGALAVGAIIKGANDTRAEDRQVVSNTGDRVVVLNPDGQYQVYRDDDATLRQPGSRVRTETFKDGSTRTTVARENGDQVVTIRDVTGRVLRRATYDTQGRERVLFNDLQPERRVVVSSLPAPRTKQVVILAQDRNADFKRALAAQQIEKLGRSFSLRQIREIPQVRHLAAQIDVEMISFDSGSAALKPSEAGNLADLGSFMQDMLAKNPGEMFLIEGHTDATGKAAMNLALSDRRAETVALALSEYFDIPPENMVIQGYGEEELRIDTQANEPRNRRVVVRIITPLLQTQN